MRGHVSVCGMCKSKVQNEGSGTSSDNCMSSLSTFKDSLYSSCFEYRSNKLQITN